MSDSDHENKKMSPREMVRAHAYPVFAALSTISIIVIAVSLIPISRQASRWNGCFQESLRWHRQRMDSPKDSLPVSKLWSTRYCNGGSLVIPNK
ncbi:MAG: Ets-domain-containing protein [Prochlorococcus sp.]